jgi:hypothetical protein
VNRLGDIIITPCNAPTRNPKLPCRLYWRSNTRFHSKTAAEPEAVILLGACMTTRAAADVEHGLAVRNINLPWLENAGGDLVAWSAERPSSITNRKKRDEAAASVPLCPFCSLSVVAARHRVFFSAQV